MATKKSKQKNILQQRKSFSHLQILLAVLLFGVMGTLIIVQSFAAAPAKGGSSSGTTTISQPILVTDNNANGAVDWSDKIRFNVSSTQTAMPFVSLKCYQGSTLVSQGTEGYFAGALDDGVFGLYSPSWTGGAADCTADVKSGDAKLAKQRDAILASVSFHVNAQGSLAQ
jgi:hypothetical protein